MTGAPLVAVTGATGFLGGHLVQALADAGARVRILARRPPAAGASRDVEVIPGDLADDGALRRLVRNAHVLIHAAGLIKARDRETFLRVNRDGAALVGRILRETAPGARLVAVSSLAAREPELSPYAASKRAGEDALRLAHADAPRALTILRPPMIYGPGDRETLAIFQAARWPWAVLVGTGRIAAIHVADAAAAIAAVAIGPNADQAAGRTWALADDTPGGYPMAEVMRQAAHAMGRPSPPRLIAIPGPMLLAAGRLSSRWGALRGTAPIFTEGKAREILHPDWTVPPHELLPSALHTARIGLAEGFRDTVAWYRAAGWLK
ncbi:NAD-dependent epimerase/dehydratase family protein [Nitrospirillum sp. BR 11828]|uniref:NAD-dependent epimerase/dehydratase family protein n=1 Tax=Nitrospirillum sp. BR 11828 TaxID=3104325 RepID=UPI002ACA6C42|nr:SDR family NAD(P)-dependent oxidoreductase [Nitrospirillum sp. BR 11828]MDZ5645670.1 SDR family NAD(P)-dependent oxidoreductase [Nitrospirillum sp. BR 11828]